MGFIDSFKKGAENARSGCGYSCGCLFTLVGILGIVLIILDLLD